VLEAVDPETAGWIWFVPSAGTGDFFLFLSLSPQPDTRTKVNKTKIAIQLLLIMYFIYLLPKIFGNTLLGSSSICKIHISVKKIIMIE
jgi:hypothetical protein